LTNKRYVQYSTVTVAPQWCGALLPVVHFIHITDQCAG